MVKHQPTNAHEEFFEHALRSVISTLSAVSAGLNFIDGKELTSSMPWFKTGEQLLTEKHPVVKANSAEQNGPSQKKPRFMTTNTHAYASYNSASQNQGEHCGNIASVQNSSSVPTVSHPGVPTNPSYPDSNVSSCYPINSSHPSAKLALQASEIKPNATHSSEQYHTPRFRVQHETPQHQTPQFNHSTGKSVYAPTPSALRANEQKAASTIQGLINQASQFPPPLGSPSPQVQYNTHSHQPSHGTPPPACHTVVPSQKPLFPQVGSHPTPQKPSITQHVAQARHSPSPYKPQNQKSYTSAKHTKPQHVSSVQQTCQQKPNYSSQPNTHARLTVQPPSRPTTPKGTIIKLPANRETAESAQFERNGSVINVWGLARWAVHHADWAEYLRFGGGDEEAWWLYRKWKGLKGYSVSGYQEKYEERLREINRQAEARRSEARLMDGMIGPPPASSTMTSSNGVDESKGAANASAQSEQCH